jgi:hypothetical protein
MSDASPPAIPPANRPNHRMNQIAGHAEMRTSGKATTGTLREQDPA